VVPEGPPHARPSMPRGFGNGEWRYEVDAGLGSMHFIQNLYASVSSRGGKNTEGGDPDGGRRNGVGYGFRPGGGRMEGDAGARMSREKKRVQSHALRPGGPTGNAGTEIQRVVAFVSGLVLAGVSQAKQHVSAGRRQVTSSFCDSFSLPWKPIHRERQTYVIEMRCWWWWWWLE